MEWNDKPAISLGWIIATFILFFPVGIILLLIRLVKHFNLSFQKTEDLKAGGYVFISLLCFYGTIGFFSFTEITASSVTGFLIGMSILFLLPGIALLVWSKKSLKKLEMRYWDYNVMITERNIRSIVEIAQQVRKRRMIVINDLRRMIYLGYFDGHVGEQFIVLHNQPLVNYVIEERYEFEVTDPFEQPPLPPKSVECSGCGSRSTVRPGATTVCDYCGASLVYPA